MCCEEHLRITSVCVYVLTSLFSMIGDVKHSMPTDFN